MFGLFPRRLRHRSFLLLLLLSLCVCCGWGLAGSLPPTLAQLEMVQAEMPTAIPVETGPADASDSPQAIGTVDPVAPQYQRGQALYLENCATCHMALPPAVLPSQTWTNLLQDQEHYGMMLPHIRSFDRQLINQYLNVYSRSLRADERTPYRMQQARHFQALHPDVPLPRPLRIESCASCHPKADMFNFREWRLAAEDS